MTCHREDNTPTNKCVFMTQVYLPACFQKAACVGFKRPTATTSPGAPVSVFFGISVLYRLDWGFGRRSWALYSDYQSKFPPECLRFPCNPWLTEARELCTSAVDCLHRLMGAHTPPFTYRQRQTCWQNSGTHTHTHTHTCGHKYTYTYAHIHLHIYVYTER